MDTFDYQDTKDPYSNLSKVVQTFSQNQSQSRADHLISAVGFFTPKKFGLNCDLSVHLSITRTILLIHFHFPRAGHLARSPFPARSRVLSDVLYYHRTFPTTGIMTEKWDCEGRSIDLTGKKKLVVVDFDNTCMSLVMFSDINSIPNPASECEFMVEE
jgi:hypothetical protein